MRYLGGTSCTTGEAEEGDLGLPLACTEFTFHKVRVVGQTVLNQFFNGCVRSIKCCPIYDHDPLLREADLLAGLCRVLQELGVNDNGGSLGESELMGKLIDGVCRVRVPNNTMN